MDKEIYWPNGTLKRRCHFEKGVRHGLDQMWNEEGILIDTGKYEWGRPVGIHQRFNKKGALIEEIEYLEEGRLNIRQWNDRQEIRVNAKWIDANTYEEKAWDRFENVWVEKRGVWDGKKLVYI